MKRYLDICALKRPFDDQTNDRVAGETRAVLEILKRIDRSEDCFVWSTALATENNADPEPEASEEVARIAERAVHAICLTPEIESGLR